ncbi:hypothetical protein pb186bvf_000659 [Paramecium bursaria]
MKVTIFAILFVSCLGFSMEQRLNQKHVEKLKETKWGTTLLSMMQLHAKSNGPVQELIQAIADLIDDLENELEQLNLDFKVRTNEHNAITTQLELDIQAATIDYQRTTDTIENLLTPRRDQLKAKIDKLIDFQDGNRKNKDETELKREQERADFELQLEDFNSGIEATDQALNLLQSLRNPSLLEIKKIHVSLNVVAQKFKGHHLYGPLIKALITLANQQNFTDQGIVQTIIDKLNEFRNQVVQALNDATAQEVQNLADFEARIHQLDQEFQEFASQITRITIDLDATVDKIQDLTQFASQRDQDRQGYQGQLDIENSTYAEETQIYNDLKSQYIKELGVAETAQKLVESADLSGIKL